MSIPITVFTTIVLVATTTLFGGTYTLEPEADSFVQANTPTTNFGTNTKIYVANRNEAGYHQDGILRFDLSSIPASETITSATLRLTVNQQNGDTQIVYSCGNDTWGETMVNWGNCPSSGSILGQFTVSALGQYNTDVTGAAQTEFGGDKKLSLFVKGNSTTKQIVYWSRNYATAADRPKLIVTTTAGYTDVTSLNAAIAAASPGATIYVANGTYNNWSVTCATSGSSGNPITIAAASPGGVTFTGASTKFLVTGNHVTISGFRFDSVVRTDNNTIVELQGTHGRVTQCAFKSCGHFVNGAWADWSRIVGIKFNSSGIGAANSKVDRNYFYDSKSVSVGLMHGYNDYQSAKWATNCTIEYNWFYKLPRLGANGGEAIQLCSGGDGSGLFQVDGHDTGQFQMFTTVQYNYFYKADSDPEICSIKCSDNTVRYNTFHSNTLGSSGLTIRGGSRNKIIGNFVFNTRYGLRVYGHDHKVLNNYLEATDTGILVNGDTNDGETGEYSLFAFNTMKGSFAVKLDVPGTSGGAHTAGAGNTWYNNIFQCGGGHEPVDDTYEGSASHVGTWNKNVLWNGSTMPLGWQPPGSIWGNPQLTLSAGLLRPGAGSVAINAGTDLRGSPWLITDDLDGHARSNSTPDIGCDEIFDNVATPPSRKPLKAIDVGPSYLSGTPWGDPSPDPGI